MGINSENKVLVFYDGECALCNWSIQFLVQRDKQDRFAFVSLNSPTAKSILNKQNPLNEDTIIILHHGKTYIKSNAVLVALKQLGGLWQLFAILKILPKFIRDSIYDVIAKNRRKWFGQTTYCRLPDNVSNL